MKDKPHVKLARAYWEIYRSREKLQLIAVSSKFDSLKRIGPWRPAEITEWYGDTKKPV